MLQWVYMYKYIFSFIFVPLLCLTLAAPVQASHGNGNGNHNNNGKSHYNNANSYYQPTVVYQSQSNQLAQLYALIAQLQAQLAALQAYNPVIYPPYSNGGYSSSNEISRVVTGSVDSDGNDSVSMEGEVTFNRDTRARVWFEYGTTNKLSYSTESVEIDGDSGDTEDFDITASDLDDNKVYYYRAVAEDDNGRYVEGAIKSFRFDGSNNYDDDDDNDFDGDWSLEVEDDSYETGDLVRVDYEVDDRSSQNWIGLYEVGDSDSNYITYKYAPNDEGYVTFRINNEGEYEFRLFDEDDDQVAESDEFEVEDN
jgi:hypothetical protein